MRNLQIAVVGIALLFQLFLPAKAGSKQAGQPLPRQEAQEGQTANELLRDCTYTVRLLDGDSRLTPEETWSAFHCSGYLSGFLDGYVLGAGFDKLALGSSHPLFCLPDGGIAGDQDDRIVVKWLREHPERLHEPARILVMIALREAFPCK